MLSWRSLILTIVFFVNVVLGIQIFSPAAGSIWNIGSSILLELRVEEQGSECAKICIVTVDSQEYTRLTESVTINLAPMASGFHYVSVAYESVGSAVAVSPFLVADLESETIQPESCFSIFPNLANGTDSHEPGFSSVVWRQFETCLAQFLQIFPSTQDRSLLCQVLEVKGQWADAANCYNQYRNLHPKGNSYLDEKVSALLEFERAKATQLSCSWERIDSCFSSKHESATCQHDHTDALIVNGTEDLYLSVIMVSRHDNTQYCQVPRDSCLERLRCSLSVLLDQLASNGLANETEIILVEWNPCYLNSRKDEGACDEMEVGYVSLEEAVRTLVDISFPSASLRVILVTEEMHNSLYNPYDFDLMEFIGKNIAARRARGRFLLFTNPDDCMSDAMVAMLARRRLREDVVYSTFRGAVRVPVPVGRGASGASMRRFVGRNSESSENQPLSVAHQAGRWRRAACMEGEVDEEPMRSGQYGFYHDSAAGDFLLIAKARFVGFRGYPEIPTNIMIDGTALHAAAAHGMGQLVLAGDCVIWHQPHPRSYNTKGSMLSLPGYEALAQQLLDAGIFANIATEPPDPPDRREWHRWNDAAWGFALSRVPQVVLAAHCE